VAAAAVDFAVLVHKLAALAGLELSYWLMQILSQL
jgi:hypothetical protein